MNPSPDPAFPLGSLKLVPSRYYAHDRNRSIACAGRPHEEEATALAIALVGDKPLLCTTGAQLREPGAQRFLNFQASEVVKEPPLTRIEREERPQRITALFVRALENSV
jgi:hypothetical protein